MNEEKIHSIPTGNTDTDIQNLCPAYERKRNLLALKVFLPIYRAWIEAERTASKAQSEYSAIHMLLQSAQQQFQLAAESAAVSRRVIEEYREEASKVEMYAEMERQQQKSEKERLEISRLMGIIERLSIEAELCDRNYYELVTLYKATEKEFWNQVNRRYSVRLRPGKPCPVCGSTEHFRSVSKGKCSNPEITLDNLFELRKKIEDAREKLDLHNNEIAMVRESLQLREDALHAYDTFTGADIILTKMRLNSALRARNLLKQEERMQMRQLQSEQKQRQSVEKITEEHIAAEAAMQNAMSNAAEKKRAVQTVDPDGILSDLAARYLDQPLDYDELARDLSNYEEHMQRTQEIECSPD